jgi:competence protein ComEA
MSARSIPGKLPETPSVAPEPERQAGGLWRPLIQRLCAFARDCAWLPLAGKVAMGIAAFLVLALVGSGKAVDLLPAGAGPYLGPPAAAAPPSAMPVADAGVPPPVQAPVVSQDGASHGASPDAGAPAQAGSAGSEAKGGAVTADGKVILNLATEDDLRKLPGIGPSKAQRILALRQKLGKFRRVEDLLRVKGIGRKSLGRLRPRLLVDPPP